jgi:hypothetical protein
MLKKIFQQLFLLAVVLQCSGIPVLVHYCGSTRQATLADCEMCAPEPAGEESSCCTDNENEDSAAAFSSAVDCCNQELLAVPLKTDLEKPSASFVKFSPVTVAAALLPEPAALYAIQTTGELYSDTSPPGQSRSLTILYSSLLI